MPKAKMHPKKKERIIDYLTRKKGTPVEASKHFGVSRTTIYNLMEEYKKELDDGHTPEPVIADPERHAPGKHGCRCCGCNRLYWRYPESDVAAFICSQQCYTKLRGGEFSQDCLSHYPNLETFKTLIKRALKRCDELKCFFAFKTHDKDADSFGEVLEDDLSDMSDLISE